MTVWLIGAGDMAAAHAAVLQDMAVPFMLVGRSEQRVRALADRLGAAWVAGGVEKALQDAAPPSRAVVATPVDQLARVTTDLVAAGVKEILLEKPGGMDLAELDSLVQLAEKSGAGIFLAYNRRFFASVQEARQRIDRAGGALSIFFEFTELAYRVEALDTPDHIKQRWLLGNSGHVIDLAFYLGGRPTSLAHHAGGSLPWHKSGSVFRGFGETDRGTLFSYIADWRGPGRWGIEVILPDERLVLRPLERLQSIPRTRFEPEPVSIDDDLDKRFKPGLYRQMASFLSEDKTALPTIAEHYELVDKTIWPLANY